MKILLLLLPPQAGFKIANIQKAFPLSPLNGTQIQKSEMLTYMASKTTLPPTPIMVNYEFLTTTGPFVFMCMLSVFVAAWICVAFRLYLHTNELRFFLNPH